MHRGKRTPEQWARELEMQRARRARSRDLAAHAAAERLRYWRARGYAEPPPIRAHPARTPRAAGALPALVDAPAGHEIYDRARARLHPAERAELGSAFDSGARDLLQAYALAELEGADPDEAIREIRRQIARDRRALIHGTAIVDDLRR